MMYTLKDLTRYKFYADQHDRGESGIAIFRLPSLTILNSENKVQISHQIAIRPRFSKIRKRKRKRIKIKNG